MGTKCCSGPMPWEGRAEGLWTLRCNVVWQSLQRGDAQAMACSVEKLHGSTHTHLQPNIVCPRNEPSRLNQMKHPP